MLFRSMSVARSILRQILLQNDHLLPYFHEKASVSGDAILTSMAIAKELLDAALNSCEKAYIIIDGLDECQRQDRKEIASWFETTVEALPARRKGSIRCLFVSQDDVTLVSFQSIPMIKIMAQNQSDIKSFAIKWHKRLEDKFGALRTKTTDISLIISARAQGTLIAARP